MRREISFFDLLVFTDVLTYVLRIQHVEVKQFWTLFRLFLFRTSHSGFRFRYSGARHFDFCIWLFRVLLSDLRIQIVKIIQLNFVFQLLLQL